MQLDHVVISVPSLKDGISQFTSLGFEVTPGGSHGATENALISFADGTYIELLALKSGLTKAIVKLCSSIGLLAVLARRRPDVYRRLIPWLSATAGPLDWCVRVDDISAALSLWSPVTVTRNVSQLAIRYFERTLPDGRVAQWHLGSPTNFELPFLLSDVSDISIRVPLRTTPHPNGALGIQMLSLAMVDIARSKDCFESVFGSDGDRAAKFQLGSTAIELAAKPKFQGRFSLGLAADVSERKLLDVKQTYGTSIHLNPVAAT